MFDPNSNANSDLSVHENHLSNSQEDHNQNPSYSYLNFPSHLLDDDLFLGTILPHQQPPSLPPQPPPPPPQQPPKSGGCENSSKQKAVAKGKRKRGNGGPTKPKRRPTGKTDRHSKIDTAQGPRDRRMRLSVQIARKFFDLQDMLGFDKASKTIEWLFNKSKTAIRDLAEKSCTSMEMTPSTPSDQEINVNDDGNKKKEMGKKESALFLVRESRERARARARERTKEKLMTQKEQTNPSSSSSKGNMGNLAVDDQQMLPLEDQMASVGIIEKFLTNSSSMIFDFHHRDPMMGSDSFIDLTDFPGNWVTENATISQCYGEVAIASSNQTLMEGPNCELLGGLTTQEIN